MAMVRGKRSEKPPEPRHRRAIRPPSGGKGSVGAPAIYDDVRFPHIANMLCKAFGFTGEELALSFGVSKKTIESWITKHPSFRKAVQSGRDEFDGEKIENALKRRAMGYGYTEKTVKRVYINAKDSEGCDVKLPAREVTIATKEIPPDPKSIIFWLTNRQPDRWKMVTNSNVNVKGSIEHNHTSTSITADLSLLNDKQLRALRDIVAITQDGPDAMGLEHTEPLLLEEYMSKGIDISEAQIIGDNSESED